MTTTENFDRIQAAIGLEERPRTRRQTKRENTMQDPQALTEARNEPAPADEVLLAKISSLLAADKTLAALQAEQQQAEERLARALATTNSSRSEEPLDKLDFAAQLKSVQLDAAHEEAVARIAKAAAETRTAFAVRIQLQQDAVKSAEVDVALHRLSVAQTTLLQRSAEMAEALVECKRAAWSIRRRLGRLETPERISRGLFIEKLPQHPIYFTSDAESSPEYLRWAAARKACEGINDSNGIDDELRG